MGTSQIVTLPILTKLAANFKMAATTRFAKLFWGKRKAVEEGLYSFQGLNDEMANKCFLSLYFTARRPLALGNEILIFE